LGYCVCATHRKCELELQLGRSKGDYFSGCGAGGDDGVFASGLGGAGREGNGRHGCDEKERKATHGVRKR
jgi:hypothetical protein